MIVSAIKCPVCEEIIYSRASHDFHYCHCGNAFIDGGFEYIRYGAEKNIEEIHIIKLDLDTSKQELYNDWNTQANKFGWIKDD